MDRRYSLGLIGISSLLAVQNVFPSIRKQGKTASNTDFKKAFAPRWEGLRTHSFEVFEAMPEAQFNFQPTEQTMSFPKLFTHIGKSLDIYAGMLEGTEHREEKESAIKGEVN